jgi:hypothetical protein
VVLNFYTVSIKTKNVTPAIDHVVGEGCDFNSLTVLAGFWFDGMPFFSDLGRLHFEAQVAFWIWVVVSAGIVRRKMW